jgi:hypothetical protein
LAPAVPAAGAYKQRMPRGPGQANRAGAAGPTGGQGIAARNSVFGRPGYADPVERLADMEADGVAVEVPCTGSRRRTRRGWWCRTRSRSTTWAWPVSEVERVALGAWSLQMPVFPAEFGQPDYYHERYAPLFSALEASGLPICCHIGLGTSLDELAARDPTPNKGVMVPMTPLMTAEAFGMFIMGGVFERFPALKMVFVEPGLGWVAWWLETVDDMVRRQGWSTDYPHPVTSWPRSRAFVE